MALDAVSCVIQPASSICTADVIASINDGKTVASESGPTVPGVTADNLQQYLYELCQAVAQGKLAPEKFVVGLRCAGPVSEVAGASLVDVVWLAWLQAAAAAAPASGEDGPRERIVAMLQELLKQQLVTKKAVMEMADDDLLQAAGVVVSAEQWHRKGIRVNTKMVYTQQKFNLLREEGEGFAKLLAALNRLGAAAVSPGSVAGLVLEVKALVGYFDLDPNRSIALVLQAFAAQPTTRVFVEVLRLFVPQSIGQTLGFLFQHQAAAHQAGEGDERAASNLLSVAVALIQADVVSLEGVMGHLAPDNDAMRAAGKAAVAALDKEIAAIGVISLASTAADPGQQQAEVAGQPRGPAVLSSNTLRLNVRPLAQAARAPLAAGNQKLGLLAALMRAGDWGRAGQLMGWLAALGAAPAAHPPVAAALAADVQARLGPLLDAAFPHGRLGRYALDPKGAKPSDAPLLNATLLERLQTLGLHIANEPALLSRLARALRFVVDYHLPARESSPGSAAELAKVEDVLSCVVLPGMMVTPAMPAVCAEIWALVSALPYPTRYRLYTELRATVRATPLLGAAAKLAGVELKKVLRRVHVPQDKRDKKEALRPFGRMVGKIAAGNPLAVTQTIIAQVEAYPNMVEPYVEALRYLTPLGLDILTFTIIDRLAGSGRQKLKDDGVNIADWLTALASFTGHVAKAYMGVDVAAICQYLTNQLRARQGFDLLLLKELVAVMTGTVTVTDLSAEQVDAMAGGDALRSQTLAFGVVANAKQLQKGGARLLAALQQGPREQQLALPLLVLLGQQLRVIALQTESPHLKLVAELYDKAAEALVQFGDFLRKAMAPADYARLLPPIESLVIDYGMDPEAAFQMYRPIITSVAPPAPPKKGLEDGEAGAEEGEIEGASATVAEAATRQQQNLHGAAAGQQNGAVSALDWPALAASVRAMVKEDVWNSISVELYTTFWSLSLYDVHVPTEAYEREMQRLTDQLRGKRETLRLAERDADAARRGFYVDPLVLAAAPDIPALQKECTRIEQVLEKLPAELKAQQRNAAAVAARLEAESATWLRRGEATLRNAADAFVLHCIIPRVKYSAADAVYCAKFIHRMHSLQTYGFSSIQVYDKVVKDMMELVLCSTDAEASNLGLFLQHVLSLVARWRANGKTYEAECANNPCFGVNFSDPESRRTKYDEFRKLNLKWQQKLGKVFRMALDSGEYVQIRNALIILNKTVRVYPEVSGTAAHLQRAAAKIRDEDKREDLKTQANMYFINLSQQVRDRTMWDLKSYLLDPAAVAKAKAAAKEAAAAAALAPKPAKPSRKDSSARLDEAGRAAAPRENGAVAGSTAAQPEKTAADRSAGKPPRPSDRPGPDGTAAVAVPSAKERPVARKSERSDKGEQLETGEIAGDSGSRREAAGQERRRDASGGSPAEPARRALKGPSAARESSAAEDPLQRSASSRSDARRSRGSGESVRDAAPAGSKLRADAPDFSPSPADATPSRSKDSRPAAVPAEGERASKRPRASDAGANAAGDAVLDSSRQRTPPTSGSSRSAAARRDDGKAAAIPDTAAEPAAGAAEAKADSRAQRKQEAAAAAAAEPPRPERKKHQRIEFKPKPAADKRKREEPAAAAVAERPSAEKRKREEAAPVDPPAEKGRSPRSRGRGEKKARRSSGDDASAPTTAVPKEDRQRIAAALRQLSEQAMERVYQVVERDASYSASSAAAEVDINLAAFSDATLRGLEHVIADEQVAPLREKERKSKKERGHSKERERSEKPKKEKSRHKEHKGDRGEKEKGGSRKAKHAAAEEVGAADAEEPAKAKRHERLAQLAADAAAAEAAAAANGGGGASDDEPPAKAHKSPRKRGSGKSKKYQR